ncbi:MAG: histidinol-phosphatase [Bacteroidota bacterium]
MSWTNYHSHSHFCDGKEAPETHVKQAIAHGMPAFGFSTHAPVPFKTSWAMPAERLTEYVTETRRLQELYKAEIELYVGLEIDYIPALVGPSSPELLAADLDYCVGSVHYVNAFADGQPWEIDGPHTVFLRGLQEIFEGDVRAAITQYYALTQEMIEIDCPDVVGHIDKIKMQSENNQLFDTQSEWYKALVLATLEVARDADVIVEINTRGLYKKRDGGTYPSPWIMEAMADMGIRTCLNSDSHHPNDLITGFEETAAILQKAGHKALWALKEAEWQAFGFDTNGLNC